MKRSGFGRREFIKAAGLTAAGAAASLNANAEEPENAKPFAPETKFPKLALITEYSPQKLAFATETGYEGVVVKLGPKFRPGLSDSEIDGIKNASREAGCRIISLECMSDGSGKGINHIARDPAERRAAQDSFIQCLEFGHRLGCKFIGTFSGGIQGASMDQQARALASAFNERYLPVCEKLDITMGWENYPDPMNFATVPAAWRAVFSQVSSRRLGLEFDPSHLIRQYINPYEAAWEFRDRILGVHF